MVTAGIIANVQTQLSGFLASACAGESLHAYASQMPGAWQGLNGAASGVRDQYLPNLAPSLEVLAAGQRLAPAAEASLILGLLTFWNALSCLPRARTAQPLDQVSVAMRLRALGLKGDAAPVATSVFQKRPSEAAMHVMAANADERRLTPKWYRGQLETGGLWRGGVTAESALALVEFVVDLERRSDRDFHRAFYEVAGPFRDFSNTLRGHRGLTPLPKALKDHLISPHFIRSATARDSRRRKTLIGFLEFASQDPRTFPTFNAARFPNFESFQRTEGERATYNNFPLYFFRAPRDEVLIDYYHDKRTVPFRKAHRGLEETLTEYATQVHGMNCSYEWQKSAERLLYEAYRHMAAMPEFRGMSLIS